MVLYFRFLSDYRPTIRLKKWWGVLFIHMANLAAVAAWRLRMEAGYTGDAEQLAFRRELAVELMRSSTNRTLTGPAGAISVRFDRLDHHITCLEKALKCRFCGTKTAYKCSKCAVPLHPKCTLMYHTEK